MSFLMKMKKKLSWNEAKKPEVDVFKIKVRIVLGTTTVFGEQWLFFCPVKGKDTRKLNPVKNPVKSRRKTHCLQSVYNFLVISIHCEPNHL